MTGNRAVGVHGRDDVKGVLCEEFSYQTVGIAVRIEAEEAFQEALGVKLGHVLSGMLPVNDPSDRGSGANANDQC